MVKYLNTIEEFNRAVSSNKPCIVDFTATWCGPCKRIAPLFEQMEKACSGVSFYKVDVDINTDAMELAKIRSMPTFQTWRNGKRLEHHTLNGASENGLLDLASNVLKEFGTNQRV